MAIVNLFMAGGTGCGTGKSFFLIRWILCFEAAAHDTADIYRD